MNTMAMGASIGTQNNWSKRKDSVLKNIYDDMARLVDLAHFNSLSLAVFKPRKIIKFRHETVSEDARACVLGIMVYNVEQ